MNKKIIIILTITILVLVLITYFLISRRPTTTEINSTITPIVGLQDIVPGIIVPTTNIKPGELDIVAVSPVDGSSQITQTTPIEITFSQELKENEIEFIVSPEIAYTQALDGNKLIITPTEDFQTSTLYTYRVTILNDLQKIRIYTFSTAGNEPIYRPDTAPEDDDIKRYDESVRIEYPDIYLKNNTPYETTSFGITGTYSETASEFQFRVLLKEPNKNQARADFILWLQTLDLTDEQIDSLDITYE